jgi:hypothetical protein
MLDVARFSKHERHIITIREGGPLGSEDVFARKSEFFYPLLNFENDERGLPVKMLFR